ncbi:hypothetical protein ACVWXO_006404 [Bradyrhizobium sp. LM2.7]
MRLGSVQKSIVWTATSVVALTGLAWFVLHDLIEMEPGETERLLLMLHGISAYAMLIVIGSLLPLHVRSGWHRRRKRWTGGTNAGHARLARHDRPRSLLRGRADARAGPVDPYRNRDCLHRPVSRPCDARGNDQAQRGQRHITSGCGGGESDSPCIRIIGPTLVS